MTPSDLPTYMREILAQEFDKIGEQLVAGSIRGHAPTSPFYNVALSAMHRVYLDRDEGSSLREAKWQPIETAPKDGADILLAITFDDGSETAMTVASWCDVTARWRDAGDIGLGGMCDVEPTHWMPLPSGPSAPSGSSLPLPDRERTDTDIVDKREDRSARISALEEAALVADKIGDDIMVRADAAHEVLDYDLYEALETEAGVATEVAAAIRVLIASEPRAADVTSPTPPDSSLVTDEMVEAGAKTIPATGIDWDTLHSEYKHSCRGTARRVLEAAAKSKP